MVLKPGKTKADGQFAPNGLLGTGTEKYANSGKKAQVCSRRNFTS